MALKPALLGSLACLGLGVRGIVNSVNGLGSAFLDSSRHGAVLKAGLGVALATLLNRGNATTIVQNLDDRQALEALGVKPGQIVQIPGVGRRRRPVAAGAWARYRAHPGCVRRADAGGQGRATAGRGATALARAEPRHRTCPRRGPRSGKSDRHFGAETGGVAAEPGIAWAVHVTDIQGLRARCHIAALPSRREGLPKSRLEAAACGRPIVATDVPGCREVAIVGETGLLSPVDNAAALADNVLRLAQDPALRAQFGRRARAWPSSGSRPGR